MGGPRLEVFKFGICLFIPIGLMYFTGLPSFYEKQVVPIEEKWTRKNQYMKTVPKDNEEWNEYMERALEYRKKVKSDV
ncbi:hypothetical protein HMI55_007194 [Coelomomyces lativittatus]|nr:hypothetical protein HMI56_002138 [Coelomomyces lativittatus]KAJ1509940.1 hypothetical protein HMI55_007194 [Coelomomyces lativittatus]